MFDEGDYPRNPEQEAALVKRYPMPDGASADSVPEPTFRPRAEYLVVPGHGTTPYLTNNDDTIGHTDDVFRFYVVNGVIEIEHYKIRGDVYRPVDVKPGAEIT